MPQAGFDPPGEKWQLCLNIVVALPPKPPRLDVITGYSTKIFSLAVESDNEYGLKTQIQRGLEYRTSLVFRWSKVVRFSPDHSKTELGLD